METTRQKRRESETAINLIKVHDISLFDQTLPRSFVPRTRFSRIQGKALLLPAWHAAVTEPES